MTTFSRFALVCSAYCVAQVDWLAAHKLAASPATESLPVTQAMVPNAPPVACDKPAYAGGGKLEPRGIRESGSLPPSASLGRQQTIPQLIIAAARRYSVDPQRALALAWRESRFQAEPKPENPCCRSVFQLHKRYFPAMPVEQHIDVAVRFFATLVKQYGDRAELVYRGGLRAIKERM